MTAPDSLESEFVMSERTWTHKDLLEGLHSGCGVQEGDVVIVHSSQAALGRVDGGVVASVHALKDAVTPAGTLLLPVFSSPPKDGIFKIKRTPSRVGLITEAFRRSADVKRSRHPTHSVAAWGKRRDEFLADHEKTSALGPDSPFHKAAQAGAQVLMIGCNMTTLSLIHVAEALLPVPYLGNNRTLTLVDYDGSEIVFPPFNNPTDSASFTRVQDEMERRGHITHCKLADAECLRFDAMTVLNCALEMLREDPGILLCDNPRCGVCREAKKYV